MGSRWTITRALLILPIGLASAVPGGATPAEAAKQQAIQAAATESIQPSARTGAGRGDDDPAPAAAPSAADRPNAEQPGNRKTGDSERSEAPDGPEGPALQQGIPDRFSGAARVTFYARHMPRLPGMFELPGRHNHRLSAWLEWRMALARFDSTNMGVVAPTLLPHAPPPAI